VTRNFWQWLQYKCIATTFTNTCYTALIKKTKRDRLIKISFQFIRMYHDPILFRQVKANTAHYQYLNIIPNDLDEVTHWHCVGDEEFCLIENRKLFFWVVSFDDYLIKQQKKNRCIRNIKQPSYTKILPVLVISYTYRKNLNIIRIFV